MTLCRENEDTEGESLYVNPVISFTALVQSGNPAINSYQKLNRQMLNVQKGCSDPLAEFQLHYRLNVTRKHYLNSKLTQSVLWLF